jgi:hypothetical protein
MGLEERKGNLYYYEKKRVGNRVVSEYVGSGALALLAQRYAEDRADEKACEREAFKRKRAEITKIDSEIDQIMGWIDDLSSGQLIASGYHQHKGQWRKRRNESHSEKG